MTNQEINFYPKKTLSFFDKQASDSVFSLRRSLREREGRKEKRVVVTLL